jgi:hypothetical protein
MLRRVLGGLWSLCGTGLILACGYWIGLQVGYGKGARDTARLVIEMRQGGDAIDEPWDRGDI